MPETVCDNGLSAVYYWVSRTRHPGVILTDVGLWRSPVQDGVHFLAPQEAASLPVQLVLLDVGDGKRIFLGQEPEPVADQRRRQKRRGQAVVDLPHGRDVERGLVADGLLQALLHFKQAVYGVVVGVHGQRQGQQAVGDHVPIVQLEQIGLGHEPRGGHHVLVEPYAGLVEVLLQRGGQHGQLDLARGRARVVVYGVDHVQVDGLGPVHAFFDYTRRGRRGPAAVRSAAAAAAVITTSTTAEERQHHFPDDGAGRTVYQLGQVQQFGHRVQQHVRPVHVRGRVFDHQQNGDGPPEHAVDEQPPGERRPHGRVKRVDQALEQVPEPDVAPDEFPPELLGEMPFAGLVPGHGRGHYDHHGAEYEHVRPAFEHFRVLQRIVRRHQLVPRVGADLGQVFAESGQRGRRLVYGGQDVLDAVRVRVLSRRRLAVFPTAAVVFVRSQQQQIAEPDTIFRHVQVVYPDQQIKRVLSPYRNHSDLPLRQLGRYDRRDYVVDPFLRVCVCVGHKRKTRQKQLFFCKRVNNLVSLSLSLSDMTLSPSPLIRNKNTASKDWVFKNDLSKLKRKIKQLFSIFDECKIKRFHSDNKSMLMF